MYFITRKITGKKVREWKNIYHANSNQKKEGVVILISATTDSIQSRENYQDEERNFIFIKGSSLQTDRTSLMYYAPNNTVLKYMR